MGIAEVLTIVFVVLKLTNVITLVVVAGIITSDSFI